MGRGDGDLPAEPVSAVTGKECVSDAVQGGRCDSVIRRRVEVCRGAVDRSTRRHPLRRERLVSVQNIGGHDGLRGTARGRRARSASAGSGVG